MSDEKVAGISTVGEVRGFFEVFLPGLFLLLHVGILLYCASPRGTVGKMTSILLHNGLAEISVVALPFGYVLGMALRLARTRFADKVSGWMVPILPAGRDFYGTAEKGWKECSHGSEGPQKNWPLRLEHFPYPCFMKTRVISPLHEGLAFYEKVWIDKRESSSTGRPSMHASRFDFLKVLVSSLDEHASKDMFAAEMLVRHAAHMCYALFFSGLVLVVCSFLPGAVVSGIAATVACVGCGEWVILGFAFLPNLRSLRVSEVETVFTHCFRNREALMSVLASGSTPSAQEEEDDVRGD